MTADKIRILLLGTPVIMQGGKSLRIQRRLTRALLYYLAFHEAAVSRSQLVLLFWPDASEQDGRRRLREILSKLRSELPNPQLLVAEQEGIALVGELRARLPGYAAPRYVRQPPCGPSKLVLA